MRRHILILSVFLLPLVFFACATQEAAPSTELEEVSSSSEESIIEEEELVTYNVTYSGILEEGGVTIYQQGTHRLMLSDGKMILLKPAESGDAGLDLYVGKLVRVRGDVMPTVEAGGTIMKVKEIVWIRRETNEDGKEEEVLHVLCGGDNGIGCSSGYTCDLTEDGLGMCIEDDESLKDEDEMDKSDETDEGNEEASKNEDNDVDDQNQMEEQSSSTASSSESSSSAPDTSLDVEQSEVITLMIDEDYADDRWTQEYCSTHVSFCIPVHKNWYFKSFGATASLLWHVEMGAATVENFGDGPLTVDLKSGDLVALGVNNGEVKTIGSRIIGYRAWSDGRHFEVSADTSLVVPVTFVTQGLKQPE